MAFNVPVFPLLCNIYPGGPPIGAVRLSNVPCNLAIGKRVQQNGFAFGSDGALGLAPVILLPAGTDIRDLVSSTGWDIVEVPAGSERWYQVSCAETIGRGFPNEHVGAAIVKASSAIDGGSYPGLVWPTPVI